MTLNCNGKIIDFNTQKIMGILNLSEDSFTMEENTVH